MKIDLGNFGYQPREAVSARVERGDPTVQAQAMQGVAEAQLQAASRENQAWNQVGESAQRFGENLLSVVDAKVKLDMANAVQGYRAQSQEHLVSLSEKASKGELKSADIDAEHQKFVDSYKMPDISGMSSLGRQRLEGAIKEVNADFSGRVAQVKHETETVELSNSLDTQADLLKKNGFDQGESPAQTAARFDEPGMQQTILRVHGANSAAWTQKQKNEVYVNYNSRLLSANQDNYNGLNALIKKWSDPNDPDTKGLDPDQKMKLIDEAGGRKDSLEAKARQQASLNLQRAEHRQNVYDKYHDAVVDQILTTHIPPSETEIKQLEALSVGTTAEGTARKSINQVFTAAQTLTTMSEPQQQAWIDQRTADFAKNGVQNPDELKTFNKLVDGLKTANASFNADPLTTHSQQVLQSAPAPIPAEALGREIMGTGQPGDYTALKTWKAGRDALSESARKRNPSLPKLVFTAPEARMLANQRNGLKTTEEKLQFDTAITRHLGVDALKQLNVAPELISAATVKAQNPQAKTGDYLATGSALRNEKDTIYKMDTKPKASLQAQFNTVAPYIAPSAQSQAYMAGENHYVGWASHNGKPQAMQITDNGAITETSDSTWGKLADYGDGQVLVPPGQDSTRYVTSLSTYIKAMPVDGVFIDEQLKAGTARLVRTAGGLQVMKLNGAPYLSRTDGVTPLFIKGY